MSRYKRKQRNWLGVASIVIMFTSCAAPDWRHGNYTKDVATTNKRQNERDKQFKRADSFRVGTAKHYINEHKKHDGKLNLFIRDGFDIGF